MAPLSQAVCTAVHSEQAGSATYKGVVDPEWAYDTFPHGGYVLALVVDAAIRFQSTSSQRDIIHLSAHFLSHASVGPCILQIHPVRVGKAFHNIQVNFTQNGSTKVTAHLVFGNLNASSRSIVPGLTLASPSPLASRIPISMHPSRATPSPLLQQACFLSRVQWAFDPAAFRRNSLAAAVSSTTEGVSPPASGCSTAAGYHGLEWASWFDFTDPDEVINTPMLTFFSDVFFRLPDLVQAAQGERQGNDAVRYSFTTLVLNMEFKAPIPTGPSFSRRSVGLYSNGKFMCNGLHDGRVEIWSSPGLIEQGQEGNRWREEQVCLAVAHQVTIAYPLGGKVGVGQGEKRSRGHAKL